MKQQQAGFTLIELIAVIVILGIISAVAVPRFVDLSAAAEQASVEGIAGNLASASALNYAAYVADNAGLDQGTDPIEVDQCQDVSTLLQGGLSSQFAIEETASGDEFSPGDTETCNVSIADGSGNYSASNASAEFVVYGAAGP